MGQRLALKELYKNLINPLIFILTLQKMETNPGKERIQKFN